MTSAINAPVKGWSRFHVRRTKKLACYEKVDQADGHRKNYSDQALEQQADAETDSQHNRPEPRMRFFFVERSQERPNRQGDGEG